MQKGLTIVIFLMLAGFAFGQKPQPAPKKVQAKTPVKSSPSKKTALVSTRPPVKSSAKAASVKKAAAEPTPTPIDPEADRDRFDAAVAGATNSEKARLLKLFVEEFPSSSLLPEAIAYLVTARAVVGSEKLKAGEPAEAIISFKLAVEEAPAVIPERLFVEVISKIPSSLFYQEQRSAAIELAYLIEKKVSADPKQLLGIAAFYLGIENGAEAKRVAQAAIALEPDSAAGYQALGLAHRLNFELEESAGAYAKAVELDENSIPAKRSLAEMKRALGKPDEAAAIYRRLVSANENDLMAATGLILSLFDAGKQAEAEAEMSRTLQRGPKNFNLLAGAAYWYAAHDRALKAVEYGQKAIDVEPRYIWGYIALARGLMKQGRPVEAERILIKGRQYGNFPTLQYEIASARLQAGFFREAAEELSKSFGVKGGMVRTRLGGRLEKEAQSFQELLAHERIASILEPAAADDAESSSKLKLLFEITQKLKGSPDDAEIAALTDEFVNGTDKMKLHRQLYAADLLLQKNIALPKVAELIKASVGKADAGLDVSAPAAAVMASELYESRTVAFARNEVILIPDVPRQMLSAILRGRIEELAGWTLFQQKSYPEAVIRLKRAISVMPDKSAWWRSSMWRLGTAFEADGKYEDALDSYIKSYVTDRPSPVRYGVIDALYQRVHGSRDGLEEKIGPNPLTAIAAAVTPRDDPQPAESKMDADARSLDTAPASNTAIEPAATTQAKETKIPKVVPIAEKPIVSTPELTAADVKPKAEEPDAVSLTMEKDASPGKDNEKADPLKDTVVAVAEKPNETVSPSATVVVEAQKPKTEDPISSTKEKDDAPANNKDNEKADPLKDITVAIAEKPSVPTLDPSAADSEKPKAKDPDGDTPANEKADVLKETAVATSEKPSESVPQPVVETQKPKTEDPNTVSSTKEKAKDDIGFDKPEPARTTEATAGEPVELKIEPKPADEKVEKADSALKTADASQVREGEKDTPRIEPPVLKAEDAPRPGEVSETNKPADTPATANVEPVLKTEDPVKTGSAKDEPVNLFRDPLTTAEQPAKPAETAPRKPVIVVEDPIKVGDRPITRDLFDPVIIKVPKSKNAEPTQPPEKAGEDLASTKGNEQKEAAVASGGSRQRIIEGKEIVSDQRCSIELSQENISILSGGGSLGILVKIAGEGRTKDVLASTNSTADIEIRAEPELGGVSGRRFYVIKSISFRTGIFTVNFESPCGKKEIMVEVR